jgi:hypothetical protein
MDDRQIHGVIEDLCANAVLCARPAATRMRPT